MQQPPPRRGSGTQPAAFTFEAKLQDEEPLLESMLAAMVRGPLPEGVWEKLHAAAQRDERTSELAFAFEAVSQGKRMKMAAPPVSSEFLFQAARYFGDAFGDELGAVTYLERALTSLPSHAGAFAKLEQLLIKAGNTKKLAEATAAAAHHRPRQEQAPLLKRAAQLLSESGGPDEKVIELYQQATRLEPGDEEARSRLETLLLKTNRLRDVVRLHEQSLGAEPPPDEATRRTLLARIVELYAEKLHEAERALPHLEQLLLLDPTHEEARKVAQKLVVIKGLSGRAAAALAQAYEASGTPMEIARFLTIELESTRGPRRALLLARLGKLKSERMGDDKGALEAFEQALAVDAADDEARARYVALAAKLGKWVDAAKALGRVVATVKDAAVKIKVNAQLGEVLLRAGDRKRAKATLAGVLTTEGAPPEALLASARILREVYEADRETKALCDVLEMLASIEPDEDPRRTADERLAELATAAKDMPRAIAAYERLLGTSARAKALAALAPLYEASGDPLKHARLLEERAKDTEDDAAARGLMIHAAEVRAKETKDTAATIASCQAIVERFGAAADVLAILVPTLEAQRQWPELGKALEQEATLLTGPEHAAVMSRLGLLRLQRLRDTDAAIEAFDEALAFDSTDKTARSTLEKLAALGDHRLQAARVLEPLYRREGAAAPLLKLLELRGGVAVDVDERLAALREAAELAEGAGAAEATRAVDVAGRGLAEAVAGAKPLAEWLQRFDRLAKPGTDPKRRAAILAKAIGDREVTSEEIGDLAKRAAEAHAVSGDVQGAIALYRRALAFEPQSAELLSRIDDLLRDQGSPRERIALYRAAARGASATRQRELLHRIGAIERHDLGDAAAAIETYRSALEADADDADAHAALAELLAQTEQWPELCALLEARLERVEGDAARTARATLASIAAAHGEEARARTQCARLLEDAQLAPEHLDAVEAAAERLGDPDLARAAIKRRIEMAQDPREQVIWLDKLGDLEQQRRDDPGSAGEAWKRAGTLAQEAGDEELARRLLRKARKVAPDDHDVTARLAALCEKAESWEELPALYAALLELSTDDGERVDLWLRSAQLLSEHLGDPAGSVRDAARAFELAPTRPDVLAALEGLCIAAGAIDAFEQALDEAIARLDQVRALDGEQRAQLLLARTRVLGSDPARADDAAKAYRGVLGDARVAGVHPQALASFDALVAADPDAPRRRADRRWLLEWRAEHAPEQERAARLLEWARAEEEIFADPVHALAIHRRVLAADADSDEALTSVARLALTTGDTDEALAALRARRDRAEGTARSAIELETAQVLLARTTRWSDALGSLRAVLAETPNDPAARALASQLLAHRATRADAIRMLEQACDASEDAEAKAQILVRLLDAPADADDATARRGWFERLCDLQRSGGDMAAALATAVRAAREMPEVPALWDRVEELARAIPRADEVAALYEEVLARPLGHDEALTIGERAVQFYEEWFEDSGRVVRILERVLEIEPTADWAFDRLKLLLDSAERWDDLFALYDRALDKATPKKRSALLEEAAQTAKDFADRPDRAIQYLEQLHELKPGDPKLVSSLERLYERQGRHRELVSLLITRLPSFKRDEARRTRSRVATLWLDELGDASQALEIIEPLLQHPEEGANGSEADLWALLERILAASPAVPDPRRTTRPPPPSEGAPRSKRPRKSEAPPSAKGSTRQRAAAWLRDHYAGTGQDGDLARMLLVELESVRSAKERVRRHVMIAEIYEKAGDAASALEQVGSAVVLDPQDAAKRAKLVELAERMGRFERLADLVAAAADACDDGQLRIELTLQAAGIRAERLGDAAGAITLLSAVLAARRVRDEDTLSAAVRLEPLLEAAGRDEERLDVVERIAEVAPDAAVQRQALGRAAQLASHLGQDERAVALWDKCAERDPRDLEALDGLVDLLDRAAKHARLAQVLGMRAEAAASPERRRADRVRAAKLLGETLDRPKDSIAAWREIEAEFGPADDAALALATLLRATERWKELAELLERGAQRTSDDGTQAELLAQLGDVRREELGEVDEAIETYRLALAADPSNARARGGLLVRADDEAHREIAVKVLLGALRARDDWRAILDLTPQRILAAGSDAERLSVLAEAAEIAEQRAGDNRRAFEARRQAFVIAPADAQSAAELARLAEVSESWQGLVEGCREAIAGEARGDRALVARLLSQMGDVLENRLGDDAAALEAYLQVAGDAADVEAACAAVRVAGRLGKWEVGARAVVDLTRAQEESSVSILDAYERAAGDHAAWAPAASELVRAAEAGLTGAGARDVEARVAIWHRDQLGDPAAAEAALTRALAHDAGNAGLLQTLAQLQRRRRDRALVETLLRLSRATGGDLALLREAAEVARDSVGDRLLATTILGDLLALTRQRWTGAPDPLAVPEPGDLPGTAEWAVENLARLHGQDGNARAELDVLVEGDTLPFAMPVRLDMRRRAARVALDALGDHDRAIVLYLALLDDSPQDEEAIEKLGAMYLAHGRTGELLSLRQRQVATAVDPSQRAELRLEVARLQASLGNGADAVETLRANLAEDPRHEPTVAALTTLLDAEGRMPELRDLLADQAQRAEQAGEAPRAAELWSRAAKVAEQRLRDVHAAETYHARVVAAEARPASLDALARLATARGDSAAAAAWLEKLIEATEPAARVAAMLRLADALVQSGQAERAAERLAHALSEQPKEETLRDRLATLYREQQAWSRLADLVAASAEHAPDKAARMARLLEAAALFTGRCAQPELAVPLLEQASDLAPEDPTVRLELAGTLASARRFDDARAILQAMIDGFGGRRPKERAPVHYQVARLELAMGNRARALVELDTATRVDPQNPEILRTLAELARDDGQLDRAERSYRALLVVLRRREDAGDTGGIARSEVLLELSAIAERQGEGERAREILESALEAATTDFEQERLEAALRARGDDETLVRVLEAKLARLGETPAAAKTLAELADVLADRLGRPEQALPMRLRAVALDPRSPSAHDSALQLARTVEAVERYIECAGTQVDRAIEGGDVGLASSLLVRLGGIAEQDLHDTRRSAALYERALELGVRSQEVLRSLDHVYEQLHEPGKQARVLALRAEVDAREEGPRAAADATYRLATLRLATRETMDDGCATLRRALDLDPQLERAEEILRRALDLDPSHAMLVELYEHVGRQPGHERTLVEALGLRARLPGGDIETVREAVEVAVRIGEAQLAEKLLERFVDGEQSASQNVGNLAWAMGALAGLRETAGDVKRAVELKRAAAKIADPEVARRLEFEVAKLAANQLDDLVMAAETYEGLLARDPADREAWEPLIAVYRRQGDASKLATLLSRVVDYVDDVGERARLRLERVRTMVDSLGLGDAEATPLLREIVDEDPSEIDAALMLAGILERTGARDELAELLARQLDSAKDREDATAIASLALRLGGLLEETDRIEARNVYYAGLDWEPTSRPLLDALSRLLGDEGDASERADLLERRLTIERGPGAEAMALQLARAREEMGDPAAAERALEIGYRGHPASVPLRDRLERAFRERQEWRKLADLWVLDAGARDDRGERVARLREAATLRRERLDDPRGAADALRVAREAAPGDLDILHELVESLVAGGDPGGALTELSAAIERDTEDPARRADSLALRSRVRANAGDLPGALEDIEAAFTLDRATHAPSLADQLEQSRAAAEAAGDEDAARVLRLRAAQVLPYAGRVDDARAILTDLVRQAPKDKAALRTLASLETALERWDAAGAALRRLVALEEDGEAAVETALRLTDVCEQAGRPGDARGVLERARIVAPQNREVTDRLQRVYELTGAWHELAELALQDARASGDVAERFAALVRAGALLLEQAGDAGAAMVPLEEARALRPTDPHCVALLADAYTLAGRAQEATSLLEQVIAPHKGKRSREIAPLYIRLARAARYVGDAAAELRSLSLALDCDSQNGEVCSDVAIRAVELDQLELANRALRAVTLLKAPGPMSKALAYQYMGEIARKQGDPKRALMLLKRALTEDPSLEGARALIDAIERGT